MKHVWHYCIDIPVFDYHDPISIIGHDGAQRSHSHPKHLVERLIYLSQTGPYIAYSVSLVSQYMYDPQDSHMQVVFHILISEVCFKKRYHFLQLWPPRGRSLYKFRFLNDTKSTCGLQARRRELSYLEKKRSKE